MPQTAGHPRMIPAQNVPAPQAVSSLHTPENSTNFMHASAQLCPQRGEQTPPPAQLPHDAPSVVQGGNVLVVVVLVVVVVVVVSHTPATHIPLPPHDVPSG